MPMGIVSDDEFLEETKDSLVPSNIHHIPKNNLDVEIIDIQKGRGQNPEVPDSLRKIIGETSALEGNSTAVDLAARFNISKSSVSAYANGSTSTSTYNKPDGDLRNHINNAKERLSKKARQKMLLALSHITSEKLESSKAIELAGVARNMAAIVKDMEPPVETNNVEVKNQPQFIFYAPQLKDEKSFDVIYSKE